MIKVYTTTTCVYCHALMNWLEDEGIKFEEVDATGDDSITAVPVTRIDQKDGTTIEIVGFDRPSIKAALKNAK